MSPRKKPSVEPAGEVERAFPHDLEVERALLGSVLMNPEAFHLAARGVRATEFFRDAHRRLWEVFHKLLEPSGATLDMTRLVEYLKRKGDLDEIGGPAYLAALVDGIPRGAPVKELAAIIREKALYRAIIGRAQKVEAEAYAEEDTAHEVLQRADRGFLEMAASSSVQSLPLSETALAVFQDLETRCQTKGLVGMDTGFKDLNEITGGWQRGDLVVVGARPSVGKTTFAMDTARVAAASGDRVAFFSLEMRRRQLEYRWLSAVSEVPLSLLLGGRVFSGQWTAITAAMETIRGWDIHVDDGARRTVEDIRSEARRLRGSSGLRLVVVDYVQLMAGSTHRKGATRTEEIADISRRLKIMADELNTTVLLLSQLSRSMKGQEQKPPQLSDLRDCGALEQDADVVLLMHRKDFKHSGPTNFFVEKQRNGPTGTVVLDIEREITRFRDGQPIQGDRVVPGN